MLGNDKPIQHKVICVLCNLTFESTSDKALITCPNCGRKTFNQFGVNRLERAEQYRIRGY